MPTVRRFPDLPDVHCSGEALGSPIYRLGLQWAVTADGVERRDGSEEAAGWPVRLGEVRKAQLASASPQRFYRLLCAY